MTISGQVTILDMIVFAKDDSPLWTGMCKLVVYTCIIPYDINDTLKTKFKGKDVMK